MDPLYTSPWIGLILGRLEANARQCTRHCNGYDVLILITVALSDTLSFSGNNNNTGNYFEVHGGVVE